MVLQLWKILERKTEIIFSFHKALNFTTRSDIVLFVKIQINLIPLTVNRHRGYRIFTTFGEKKIIEKTN